MQPTPHTFDAIRCKHCDAVLMLTIRAAIRDKFHVTCWCCQAIVVVWPAPRAAESVSDDASQQPFPILT